jgi:hypothetical protein
MSIADDLASLEKEPTAAQLVRIFHDNGAPLKTRGKSVVAPAGITPQMSEMIHRHEAGIVSQIHSASKKEKEEDDNADRSGSQSKTVSGRTHQRRGEAGEPASDVPVSGSDVS